jgi:hypothetical protein
MRPRERHEMPMLSSRSTLRAGSSRPRWAATRRVPVEAVEPRCQDARSWKDDIDVTRPREETTTALTKVPLTARAARYNEGRGRLRDALVTPSADPRFPPDAPALLAMCRALDEELGEERSPRGPMS